MDQIVECVPNFSEGRNKNTIDAIANEIRKYPNVHLIDVDPGFSTNRTVYTIVGKPEDVIKAVVSAAKVAFELIDMRQHSGEHKRLGALDVLPFIPIKNVNMKDCISFAKICAQEISKTLQVPTYLYGYAATQDYRRTVPDIRKGEYEGLKEKLKDPEWKPDYGPTEYSSNVARYGATMVGARKVLIAYNINLIATKEQANKIAFDIREHGRGPLEPGCFKSVQAMGWLLEEKNIAQITINIIDFQVTSIYQIWKEVNKRAKEYCLPVCGSEIVGCIPLEAILDVANQFIKEENILILEEELKVQYVISKLGLNSLYEFKPKEKIIEYILNEKNKDNIKNQLINLNLKEFIDQVRNRNVVPGGGSVSALVGSLATSLVVMVGKISSGKKKFEENDNLMKELLPIFHDASDRFLNYVDLDSQAYTKIVEANRLPEKTDEEATFKQSSLRFATMNAIDVPKKLINDVIQLMQRLDKLVPVINMNACSDLQVAIVCFRTAVYGAYYNVVINLEGINHNQTLKNQIYGEVNNQKKYVDELSENLLNQLELNKNRV